MKTILETCVPRPEVLTGELRDEMFAARLRDVVEETADPIYQKPDVFFRNTFVTEGLRTLVQEALGRLSGKAPGSSPFIRLETAFGGGKTHNLIALYHLAKAQSAGVPENMVDPSWIPEKSWDVAGIVGSDLDPVNGIDHGDAVTNTLWGEIGWQIGGKKGYDLFRECDESYVSPGTQPLEKLVGNKPTLILIDELARYFSVAKAVETKNKKSDLGQQTLAFLMSLIEFTVSREKVCLVISLADSRDAFGRETEEIGQALIEQAKRLSARQERVITPTGETEISRIVCHRLFESVDRSAAEETAKAYSDAFKQLQEQSIEVPARVLRAEYTEEIVSDYPFHPELLAALNKKTSTIPNFQKTRGALRLLARVVRGIWDTQPDDAYLIHIHHLDLGMDDIANDLTSRLERPAFKSVIEADISSPKKGTTSHCQAIDRTWTEAGKPPYARRIATTIFLHSLTQGIATGVEPADMLVATILPGDDPQHLRRTLSLMTAEDRPEPGLACWYLDYDGHRYRFKTEPGLEMIIQQELSSIGVVRTKNELDDRIRGVWKKNIFQPVYFPQEAVDLPDDSKEPKLAILHYDACSVRSDSEGIPDHVKKLFSRSGTQEGYRSYKNNVLFLVADADRIERMVSVMSRYLAVSRIVGDGERMMEFSQEQRKRLHDMCDAAKLDVRIAITKAYRFLYYPSSDAPKDTEGLSRSEIPAQDQGDVQKDQSTVVLRTLQQIEKVVTADSSPLSPAYVKAKAWPHGQESMTTEDLRKEFCRRIGLRIVLDVNQLKKTIKLGVSKGTWIYYQTVDTRVFGPDSRDPYIQFSEDSILYTMEEAKKLKVWPPPDEISDPGPKCPVCGKSPCECGTDVPVVEGDAKAVGVPAQAFQAVVDILADRKIDKVSKVNIRCEGSGTDIARDIRALGLAIPQLPKGEYEISLDTANEFADDGELKIIFRGSWDRYKRLKQVTDAMAEEAQKMKASAELRASYKKAIDLAGLEQIREILTALEIGKISIEVREK